MSEQPYPGLRPFKRDESDIFFGRDEQVDELLNRLDRSHFLAVVGPSGCGKSSLVRAGLMAALETGFLASTGTRWRMAAMLPGNRPLQRLAEALLDPSALGSERAGPEDATALLRAELKRGPLGLVNVMRETPLPENTNLLLLVDQFEEIFRYHREGGADEVAAFIALLLATAGKPESRVFVVLTMRSDYLGDCALFQGLPEAMNESQFLTPRLAREQQRAAIEGPAGVFGAGLEPALVNRLLNDMGSDPDQLPLMQHVLMRMWDMAADAVSSEGDARSVETPIGMTELGLRSDIKLTLDQYEEVGGLENALSKHVDAAFEEELDRQDQRVAETLFRCLTERGRGRRDSRHPTRLGTTAAVAGVKAEDVARVVEVFRMPGRSFITPAAGVPLTEDTVLDISHESLIRRWTRLQAWARAEAQSAATYRRLEETAQLWNKGEAALWGTPDLDVALEWRNEESPTREWARRYGGDFERAMEFLGASEQERKRAVEAREAARSEELDRARREAEQEKRLAQARAGTIRLLGAFSVALLFVILAAGVAILFYMQGTAQTWIASRARLGAGLATESWRQARQGNHELSALLARQAYLFETRLASDARSEFATWRVSDQDLAALTAPVAGRPALHRALENGLSRKFFGLIAHEHAKPVRSVAFSPDGTRVASASGDGTVWLGSLDGDGGTSLDHGDVVRTVAFSADGAWLASGTAAASRSLGGEVHLWRAEDGEPLGVLGKDRPGAGHERDVRAVAFHPLSSRVLASGGMDGWLSLWSLPPVPNAQNLGELEPIQKLPHNGQVWTAAFHPDGRWLASGGSDGRLYLWRGSVTGDALAEFRPIEGHPGQAMHQPGGRGRLHSLAFSPSGRWLATAGTRPEETAVPTDAGPPEPAAGTRHAYAILLWKVAEDECGAPGQPPCISLEGEIPHRYELRSVSFDAEEKTLFASTSAGEVLAWSLADPEADPGLLRGHRGWVFQVAAGPAGGPAAAIVASAGVDGTLRLWERNEPAPTERFDAEIRSIRSDPVSKHPPVVADLAGHVWSLDPSGGPIPLEPPHDKAVRGLAISPDGSLLASASSDGRALLWDLTQPQPTAITVHTTEEPLWAADFTPGEAWRSRKWLALGGYDGQVSLFDVSDPAMPEALGVLVGIEDGMDVRSVAFGPHGKQVAAALALGSAVGKASERGQVMLWQVPDPGGATGRLLSFPDADGQPSRENSRLFNSVAFGPRGDWLAAGSWDGTVRLWSLDRMDACPPVVLDGGRMDVVSIAFSPDGALLASGHRFGPVLLWEVPQPGAAGGDDCPAAPAVQDPVIFEGRKGHSDWVFAVAFSSDGGFLLSGGRDKTLRRWEPTKALAERVCQKVRRNLTDEEWRTFVGPTSEFPYEPTCPDLPVLDLAL